MTKEKLNILYANTNHCQSSTTNTIVVATDMEVDIVMLTEPYYAVGASRPHVPGWDAICGPRSAILIRRNIAHVPQQLQHADVVTTTIGETQLICVYSSPNESNTEILLFLHRNPSVSPHHAGVKQPRRFQLHHQLHTRI